MKAMLKISFGGMVAEEIFFGESGTGPAADLAAGDQAGRRHGRIVRAGRRSGVIPGGR